jgi:hypothetical protein
MAAAKISAVKEGHIYSPGLPALPAFLPCQPSCLASLPALPGFLPCQPCCLPALPAFLPCQPAYFVLCPIIAPALVKVDFLPTNIPSAFYFSEISMGETLQLILWQL